jgi:predicted dehydrogenase/nucleoside-diphosphate-sugar epimerase
VKPERLIKLKIGIVGCGLNSPYHINFARSCPGAEIAGVVDTDLDRARRVAQAHHIPNCFGSLNDLLSQEKPDIVHVVTPPMTHLTIAQEAFELGCHVLVEKPLALNHSDARFLFDLAQRKGRLLCAMHNHLYDPCMARARKLVEEGHLGRIVNVESYYGLNTRIDAFRKYPAPNVLPWIYSLPGGPFHDFMPHPLYVMLPFIGKPREIMVMEKSFGELPHGMSDELRVLVQGENAFGVMSVSFAAKPHQHFLRVYGTMGYVHVDFNTMTTTLHRTSRLPKAAQRAVSNFSEGWQLISGTVANIWNFGRGKLRPYQGMKTLIHRFYDAVNGQGDVPVSREEALAVIETIDEICKRMNRRELKFEPIASTRLRGGHDSNKKVLVTGATGFLGTRLVELLLAKGFIVRALARKLSNVGRLRDLGAAIYFGDVASVDSLKPAFEDIDYIVHAAADTTGDERATQLSTVQGTKNVVALSREFAIKKLVYVSSCSVYGVADFKPRQVVTEDAPLERFPRKRGWYSEGKTEAEAVIREAIKNHTVPIVCLRPGTIFGPGGETFTPMMGFSLGDRLFAIIGNGRFTLPLIYIDNLVEAITRALDASGAEGRIYNVVDPCPVTKREHVDLLIAKLHPDAYKLYVPYSLLYTLVSLQELLCKAAGRRPFLTRYRLTSSQKNVIYDSSRIRTELGWEPSLSFQNAANVIVQYQAKQQVSSGPAAQDTP